MSGSGVGVVISAFRPGPELADLVSTLAAQVDLLVVVDDSADRGSGVRNLLPHDADEHVVVIENPSNLGLAASLNIGVAVAIERGLRYVGTFDQDSMIESNYVSRLLSHLVGMPREAGVLVAGPALHRDRAVGVSHPWRGGMCSLNLTQSGMLFDVEVFSRVGPFREEFFIDGLEQDFLLRLHRRGLHTSVCPGLSIDHQIGSRQEVSILGVRMSVLAHSADRHYYVWRNHLTWIRENWRSEPLFAVRGLWWLLTWTAFSALPRASRRAYLRESVRGVRDFSQRRYGKR